MRWVTKLASRADDVQPGLGVLSCMACVIYHASLQSSATRAQIRRKRELAFCTPQRVHRVLHTTPARPIANCPEWTLYRVSLDDMLIVIFLRRNALC